MQFRRHFVVGVFLVVALLVATRLAPTAKSSLPDRLSNEEFWKLSAELSEPGGTFRSENLLSNERMMQHVIPSLSATVRPGRVYLGVGPEQNFTYIAALRPALAFIVDIRRGNLQLHLMYKALFEMSADRVEFVARLFSRARPPDVAATAPVGDIFQAVAAITATPETLAENMTAVRHHLTSARGLPLADEDLRGIQSIQQAFFNDGPYIQYSAHFGRSGSSPTYAELMNGTDMAGVPRSFLATAEAFAYVKSMHARSLIVPVVGDFAGTKALRAVGEYLMARQTTVGAFYLSNVEQYLGREGRWFRFCENVTLLPLDESSSFIRSVRDSTYERGVGLTSVTGNMRADTRPCRATP